MIQHISAVTLAVDDMIRSIEFYRKLGFGLLYGGERANFSSLRICYHARRCFVPDVRRCPELNRCH